MVSELHPLGFFLPEQTKLLMLGSFPPPMQRWSMNFYYPNIQNDMWRILGLLFYSNKEYFLETKKAFSEEKAKAFCREKGIGIGDTAVEIIRLKNNAYDFIGIASDRRAESRNLFNIHLTGPGIQVISYAFLITSLSETIRGKGGGLQRDV